MESWYSDVMRAVPKTKNKLFLNFSFRIFIGIKKLLSIVDNVRRIEPKYRLDKFLTKLGEEGGLDDGTYVQ